MMQGAMPGIHCSACGDTGHENGAGKWFTFNSFSLNGQVYNYLSVITSSDKSMLLMFNCEYDKRANWDLIFKKIAETLMTN